MNDDAGIVQAEPILVVAIEMAEADADDLVVECFRNLDDITLVDSIVAQFRVVPLREFGFRHQFCHIAERSVLRQIDGVMLRSIISRSCSDVEAQVIAGSELYGRRECPVVRLDSTDTVAMLEKMKEKVCLLSSLRVIPISCSRKILGICKLYWYLMSMVAAKARCWRHAMCQITEDSL